MDTESRYLRDIRDAIKGIAKRSGMDVSGNTKSKYLKEIADAIRENGGGGKDGNDKVKQIYINQNSDDGDQRILFSNTNTVLDTTDFVKKSNLIYNVKSQILRNSGSHGGSGSGNTGYSYSYQLDPKDGLKKSYRIVYNPSTPQQRYANTITTLNQDLTIKNSTEQIVNGQMEETANRIATYGYSDITLSSTKGDVNNTWDGINSSLKAALAAAKEGNFFIANIYDSNPDNELFGVEKETETINITSITSSSSVVVPMYSDKTYNEIKTAMESGLIPLLRDAHRIYSVYGYDFVRGTVIFKDLLSGNTYIQNEEVKTDSNLITFHEPT